MILQSLTQHYEDLVRRGEIASPGWSATKVSLTLCLDEDGTPKKIVSLKIGETKGKKTVTRPTMMDLPTGGRRSTNILPTFCWDNPAYIFGVSGKETKQPQRDLECFVASKKFHLELLKGVNTPLAKAICGYFDKWQPDEARTHPLLAECLPEILKGGNIVFCLNGQYPQDDEAIRKTWEEYYCNADNGEVMQCLVTGEQVVAQRVHPAINATRFGPAAQSSGVALVSFNAPAFCSYGHEQSLNAPVSKYVAFAYTAALNHLLQDPYSYHMIGSTVMLCWAEGAEPQYCQYLNYMLFGAELPEELRLEDLLNMANTWANGLSVKGVDIAPDRKFHILGLDANAGRLFVRFCYDRTYGELVNNILIHNSRLEMADSEPGFISIYQLLWEITNKNSTDKSAPPAIAGETIRAIINGEPYPSTLYTAVLMRIQKENSISLRQAAILRACALTSSNSAIPKEVLTLSLNENSTNVPYTLGRIFAIYEAIQKNAIPGVKSTIKDRYFPAASATPATVFPVLDNLVQSHLKKVSTKHYAWAIVYDKQITQLKSILGESYPAQLSLPERGSFNLGYYHQKQYIYTPKTEKEEKEEEDI